jgi:hypothetical protein
MPQPSGLVKLVGPVEGPPVLPRDGQAGVVVGSSRASPASIPAQARARGALPSVRMRQRRIHGAALQVRADRDAAQTAFSLR